MSAEATLLRKSGGPLTKEIRLDEQGRLCSDGSACVMTAGQAKRWLFAKMGEVAEQIEAFGRADALTLGMLAPELPDRVEITTRRRMNGAAGVIARTLDHFIFRAAPTLMLLDYDVKGMPAIVAKRIAQAGGFWPALLSVVPELATAARVERSSTSAGLYRSDSGVEFPGSGGRHIFLLVADGTDIERTLTVLHQRCMLGGLGWMMVGRAGQVLERSIVDRSVGSPERLVFEGPPVLVPPLAQHRDARRPLATDGEVFDARQHCPPLSVIEQTRLSEVLARAERELRDEAARVRRAYIAAESKALGIDPRIVERRCAGILLPDTRLVFDDNDLAGMTVGDVLKDPERFVGETLADPLEGIEYGRGKAKVLRRGDSVVVHSFAHGLGSVFLLRHDRASIEAAMRAASRDDAARVLIDGILGGDVDPLEVEDLLEVGVKVTGVKKRPLNAMLRAARIMATANRAREARAQRIADLNDGRPVLPHPEPDDEWMPVIEKIADIMAASTAPEPPARDPDGYFVQAWERRMPRLHALIGGGEVMLPAPNQVLLARLDRLMTAELIERHVAFFVDDKKGYRLVHLDPHFANHAQRQPGDKLPIVTAVATLPVVLDDGTVIRESGLQRAHGTIFRIPPALPPLLPDAKDCTPAAVRAAMRFLRDKWLVDVTATAAGKCVLIALALTIIERVVLPERPAFFVTSAVRGGGKTTALNMIALAITGQRASAAAWSPNEEERRKALFAYLFEGVPFLVWDNIKRGSQVSCPHIEKSLTAETFADRILGVSGTAAPFASTIHAFNGNKIAPRGDMMSRSLMVELPIGRLDPENRDFKHPDPFGWTRRHRDRILSALYTLLLGNPRRLADPDDRDPPPTRFKSWWDLVGSAVEHAVAVEGFELSFKELFAQGEEGDEQANGIAAAVRLLYEASGEGEAKFQAIDACRLIERGCLGDKERDNEARKRAFRLALEQVHPRPLGNEPSALSVSRRLQGICGVPTDIGGKTVMLHYEVNRRDGGWFSVDAV
jgi:hypothetical protein